MLIWVGAYLDCCLVIRGSTCDFRLIRNFSGVVEHYKEDLKFFILGCFCRALSSDLSYLIRILFVSCNVPLLISISSCGPNRYLKVSKQFIRRRGEFGSSKTTLSTHSNLLLTIPSMDVFLLWLLNVILSMISRNMVF